MKKKNITKKQTYSIYLEKNESIKNKIDFQSKYCRKGLHTIHNMLCLFTYINITFNWFFLYFFSSKVFDVPTDYNTKHGVQRTKTHWIVWNIWHSSFFVCFKIFSCCCCYFERFLVNQLNSTITESEIFKI